MAEAWFSVFEIADRLGVNHVTIRRLVHLGEIDAVKIGTGSNAPIRISESALDAYLERQSVAA